MLIIFPIVGFFLIWIYLYGLKRDSYRCSFLLAAIICASGIVLVTEFLSMFQAVTAFPLFLVWFIVTGGMLFLFKKKYPQPQQRNQLWPDLSFLDQCSVAELVFIAALVLEVVLLAVIAFVAPPNNWDSMTYHMSRVVHWIQNHGLMVYPTAIERQLVHPPGAEVLILNLQILAGSDRFANMVQWSSMLGSLLGVSLIAQRLGAKRDIQIMAAVIAGAIPMGILQSSSTQNDYVLAFWFICAVYFLFETFDNNAKRSALAFGVALGLMFYTKGTGYIYGLPLFGMALVYGFKKFHQEFLKTAILIVVCIVLMNAGQYARPAAFALGKKLSNSQDDLLSHDLNPAALFSNFVRNIGSNLDTPFPKINDLIALGVQKTHGLLGGQGDFAFSQNPFHEDNSGNAVHVLLIGGTLALFLARGTYRREKKLTLFAFLVIAYVLAYSLLLKWQPWGMRLQLPLFVLFSPWIAVALSKTLNHRAVNVIVGVVFFCSLPWILMNESRPLIGKKNIFNTPRFEQYFANLPGYTYSYQVAANEVAHYRCSDIGVSFGPDSWEYPLWIALNKDHPSSLRIEHIGVSNFSSRYLYPAGEFHPCAIVTDSTERKATMSFENVPFMQTRILTWLSVFIRDNEGTLNNRAMFAHLQQTIQLIQPLWQLLGKYDSVSAMPKDNAVKIMILVEKVRQQTLSLDTRELEKTMPQSIRYFTVLGDGLENIKTGVMTREQNPYSRGKVALLDWLRWLNENRPAEAK